MFKLQIFVLTLVFFCTDAMVSMHDPFYCYSTDPIKPQTGMFSIISTYETNRGRNLVNPSVSNCTPSKFWMVSRHGTRLPNPVDLTNIFTHSARLQQEILKNFAAGKSSLCASDIELITNWRFDPNITLEMQQLLTVTGWNEFQDLARRYQAAFPTLLPSTYSPSDYFFRSAITQRSVGSIRAFADGLFGYNGFEQVSFEEIPSTDLLLRPHDFCPLLNEVGAVGEEQDAFTNGTEFRAMLTEVSTKLGFHGSQSLRAIEVQVLYNLCRFEQIWDMNSVSPMCAAFSVANHQVLEYSEDLHFYYRFGYGRPAYRTLYENLNCFLMQDMMRFIQSNDPNDYKAIIHVGHTAQMQLLVVTLGIREDEVPLTRHNFAQQISRQWRTSQLAAKGTNLIMVKYTCEGEDNDILFLHSERPITIPGCQANGLCKQSYVLERFSRFLNGNCGEMYCRNS